MSTKDRINAVIACLTSSLGTSEDRGVNNNFIVQWYNKNVSKIGAGPWCEMTVTWAMWTGGAKALKRGRAYTVYGAQDGVNHVNGSSFHYGTKGMRRGDQVYFNWQGIRSVSGIDHTGDVERINGDGTFYTLEGNTGDRLLRRRRDGKYVVGYVRFDWSRLDNTPAPVKSKPKQSAKKPSKTTSKVFLLQHLLEISADGKWDPSMDAAACRMRNAARAKVGYPKNVKAPFSIGRVQSVIDTKIDNIWGPRSQASLHAWVESFQRLFGLEVDGLWGPKTDNKFLAVRKENYRNY